MLEYKEILEPAFIVLQIKVNEAKDEGWDLCLESGRQPQDGLLYSVWMFREFDENAVDQPPKMHFTEVRANNAAKAREAKAAKKAAQQEGDK